MQFYSDTALEDSLLLLNNRVVPIGQCQIFFSLTLNVMILRLVRLFVLKFGVHEAHIIQNEN